MSRNMILGGTLALLLLGVITKEPAFLAAVIVGVPAAIGYSAWSAHRARQKALQEAVGAALGRWGSPVSLAFGSPDKAAWKGEQGELEVTWLPRLKGQPGETEAHWTFQSGVLKGILAVATHDVRRMASSLGGEPAKVGGSSFNTVFFVRCTPEGLAEKALGAEPVQVLMDLRALLDPVGFEVTLSSHEAGLFIAGEVLEGHVLRKALEKLDTFVEEASTCASAA